MEHVNDWCFRDIYKGGLWDDDLHVCAHKGRHNLGRSTTVSVNRINGHVPTSYKLSDITHANKHFSTSNESGLHFVPFSSLKCSVYIFNICIKNVTEQIRTEFYLFNSNNTCNFVYEEYRKAVSLRHYVIYTRMQIHILDNTCSW